jgi:hypothetical protein
MRRAAEGNAPRRVKHRAMVVTTRTYHVEREVTGQERFLLLASSHLKDPSCAAVGEKPVSKKKKKKSNEKRFLGQFGAHSSSVDDGSYSCLRRDVHLGWSHF